MLIFSKYNLTTVVQDELLCLRMFINWLPILFSVGHQTVVARDVWIHFAAIREIFPGFLAL